MINLTKLSVSELSDIDDTPLFSEVADICRRYSVMRVAAINAGREYLNTTPRQYHIFTKAI